jgi:hypothetical protein
MGDLSSIDLQDDTALVRDGQCLAIVSNNEYTALSEVRRLADLIG